MKIKKITIQGFKSFVDRTQIAFPMGTSVIVGPNGCGKSNIVDAVRWVLGEHNARHLRGKVMEDLIFTGSDTRKPTGMADVILTLSNEEGNAPAQYANFTEIEIQRRLYRSGESEYYINKVPARLRDIVDLFADTGIGTRAYSIIEQGQIGWLITAKPEERRQLFEEAAGINKYRLKKESALRKLDATKANLTRVSDIISEVKRQLNSLNRQAKKAQRYKALKDELKELELHLCSLEHRSMQEKKAGLAGRLEEIKDKDVGLSTRINSKQSEAEEINLEYLKEEAEFQEIKNRAFELERFIQAEERAMELARVRADELIRNDERITSETKELETLKATLSEEAERLSSSINEGAGQLAEEGKRLTQNEAALLDIARALNEKEEKKKPCEARLMEVKAGLSEIKHALQGLKKDEELLGLKHAEAIKEKEQTERLLNSRVEPLNSLKQKIEDCRERKLAMESELDGANERLAGLEKQRDLEAQRLTELKGEWSQKSSRLAALEEMEKNREGVDDGVRAFIRSENGGSGVHGLIADVIETEESYEKAVETVLGERLNYVIVESQNEGLEAIEYLKSHASGRGSFVPIKDTRPPIYRKFEPPYDTESNGVTKLIGKVTVKEGYQTIMDYLLGDVLLVKDIHSAASIWKGNGVTSTLVTKDGEMIDPQGIITGGDSNGSNGGVLQKRREIKELAPQIKGHEEEISRTEKEVLSLATEIRSAKTALEGSRDNLYGADMERVNLEGELKINTEEMERLEEKLRVLSSQILTIQRELEDVKGKTEALSRQAEELDKTLLEAERTTGLLYEEASGLGREKEKLTELVTSIKVKTASMAERQEHLASQLEEKERLLKDTTERINGKQRELERVRTETGQKTEEVSRHKTTLEETLKKKDEVKKEEILKGETLSVLSERIKASESEVQGLKEELLGLQESKNTLSLELKELELGLGHIKEKMIEKYGTDIEAYGATAKKAGELSARPTEEIDGRAKELREKIGSMGEVSLSALEEYGELEERHRFLTQQQDDLNRSVESLHATITKINRTTRERFRKTFEEINEKFRETFPRFFKGGKAELRLSGEADILESGIEIVAQPPGKRLQSITLLSGGERALTAIALIFSIFLIKPSPFCLLDEVDAPLDDANIDRFNSFVKEMANRSQFILISHNKRTMEMADTLFGVTMEEPGISKSVTVNL